MLTRVILELKDKINKSLYLRVEVFSTAVLIVDTEISKQILQIEQKLVKNRNWREADQLAIYKAWRSSIWDHQTQIHPVTRR